VGPGGHICFFLRCSAPLRLFFPFEQNRAPRISPSWTNQCSPRSTLRCADNHGCDSSQSERSLKSSIPDCLPEIMECSSQHTRFVGRLMHHTIPLTPLTSYISHGVLIACSRQGTSGFVPFPIQQWSIGQLKTLRAGALFTGSYWAGDLAGGEVHTLRTGLKKDLARIHMCVVLPKA
jgi:hypothetical protein